CAAYAALAAGTLALHAQRQGVGPEDLLETAVFLIFVAVGGFIAARRPANPIGWLLCLVGVASAFSSLVAEYVATAAAGARAAGHGHRYLARLVGLVAVARVWPHPPATALPRRPPTIAAVAHRRLARGYRFRR